jgi:hypothetical protein
VKKAKIDLQCATAPAPDVNSPPTPFYCDAPNNDGGQAHACRAGRERRGTVARRRPLSIENARLDVLTFDRRNPRKHSRQQIAQIARSIDAFGFNVPILVDESLMDWRHTSAVLAAGGLAYSELMNLCVWVKSNGGMGSLYRSQHELIFVFKNGAARHRNNVQLGRFGRNRTNIWTYPCISSFGRQGDEGNLLALHPTVKPVALIADAILDCSARGDVVLDAFLGSGSTMIAAERVGRVCHAMDLDPIYVDTAIRRWQRYTGDVAVHAATKTVFGSV